jgi:two-component system, sporulation sensor kinase E
MKSAFLDKLIERMDRIDANSLQTHFLHLSQEKGLLETIFNALQEGIIGLDGAGRIIYANRSAGQMLGFSCPNAVGEKIGRYLRDIDWDLVLDLNDSEWSRLLNREIEVTYPEHRFIAFYIVPMTLEDQNAGGAVVLLRDITRERRTEASNLETERFRAITLLAAGVAHEIGNPLNSLTIHLQLLERELEEFDTGQLDSVMELIDVSKREVARLDQIIQKFLGAIRPVQPQLRSMRMDGILRETLRFLKPEVDDRNVLVEVESQKDLPSVRIDEDQIKQVFFNIIRNAVEAMDGGGILKITLGSTDLFATVSFRDSGCGISPDDIGNIFKAYKTSKKHGSGLGLMIVQRIIRDHGGEIEIDSAPGRGTVFTIYIPREERRMRLLKSGVAGD